jgi:predicted lipoprotein with Yx(FWY)xxD motif
VPTDPTPGDDVRVRTRLLPSVAAAALLLTACNVDDAESPGQEEGVEEVDTEATDDTEDAEAEDTDATDDEADDQAAAGDVVIEAQESDIGTHLVDGDGYTLYLSVTDGQDESTCTGDCAQLWQPVLVDGEPEAGEGIQEDLLGSFEREDDRGTQATYDGMPLYRFVADNEPGDTNGHELADTWFAVDVDGGAIGGAEIVGPPAEEEAEDEAAEGDDEDEDEDDDS